MFRLLRRVLGFFRKWEDPAEEQCVQQPELPQDDTKSKDYGLIDELIYFSCDVVAANVPLKDGQKVDATSDNFGGTGPSDSKIRVLIGCVTCIRKGVVYINRKLYFPLKVVSEGFVPYEGDWLEVEHVIQPGTSNNMGSVKPMYCKHVDEVCITNLHGRHAMIDDTIFFTLDSLKLPDGYVPQRYDVNVVMVGSMQPCCIWRAVSITLVQRL
ncbi:cancer/testis antigen 55-like [Lemur catta]|uniref:cancer/testis antigen 55-like n=1 Tax=Lemur catta TaxID=9447 RepID=UPI001E26B0D0|nr:cancer/testis antigen 55-like [Lemur catta]